MTRPEFLYFDLGNVLVQFAPERACRNLATIVGCEPAEVHRAVYESNLQWQYESGSLDDAQFAKAVNERLKSEVPTAQLVKSLANMFYWDTAMFPVISRLVAARVRIGLLSNTCAAHWEHLLETGPQTIQLLSPKVLSYEVRSIKPDAKIYEIATQLAGVPPEKIAFTDDRPENVDGALRAGWKAHLYQNPRDLMRWLSSEGLSVFV